MTDNASSHGQPAAVGRSRRSVRQVGSLLLGGLGLSDLLRLRASAGAAKTVDTAVILLWLEGGPSHIDTFDPKPKLAELHLQKFERSGQQFAPMFQGNRFFVQSPFTSRRVGNSGADLSSPFVHLANVADDICWYRGCQAESVDHPTSMYHLILGINLAEIQPWDLG